MGVPEPERQDRSQRALPISWRYRLRSAILAVAILAVPLALIVPRIHIPSEAESRAIRIVTRSYMNKHSKGPDVIKATRHPGGGWIIEATSILAPEPGGYRSVDAYRVDADWQCHWISLRAAGAF